jgi:hypothetical protein
MHRRLSQLGGPSTFNAGPGAVEFPKIVAPYPLVAAAPENSEGAVPMMPPGPSDLLSELLRLKARSLRPKLADKVSKAASDLAEAMAEGEALVQEFADADRKDMEASYKHIRARGRVLTKRADELKQKLHIANAATINAIAQRESAVGMLREMDAHERRGQHVENPQFASDEQIADWEGQKTAVRKRISAWNEATVARQAEERQITDEFKHASRELEDVKLAEVRARHALDGGEFFDPEFGLADRPGVTG